MKSFPTDIPRNVYQTYKARGNWEGWGSFLGTGIVASYLRNFKNYSDASNYAKFHKIKSSKDWFAISKSKDFPKDLPSNPPTVYKKEWKSWGSFLGTGRIADQLKVFKSYLEAKKYAHSLKLKNVRGWYQLKKIDKNFPKNIPYNPQNIYKKEWKGWDDFLGKKKKS